jgi:glycosyltransferase 2 family protein
MTPITPTAPNTPTPTPAPSPAAPTLRAAPATGTAAATARVVGWGRVVLGRVWGGRAGAWVRAGVGVGIVAVLAWRVGAGAFVAGLREISGPSVLAALGIGAVTTVVSALRWCVVARRLGLDLPVGTAVADCYRALFLNVVLPAGVLGDVRRAAAHGRRSGDLGRGVRAVVLERTGGQVVLFALCLVLLGTQPGVAGPVVRALGSSPLVLGLAGLVGAAAVALVVVGRRRPRVGAWLADLRTGLLAGGAWPAVFGLSAVVLAGHLALFLVAARTAGVTATPAALLTPVVLTLIAGGLPVNIAGWGPRESASALAFQLAGLTAAQGLTIAVVYGALTFAGSLPGALLLLPRRRAQRQLEQGVLAQGEAAGGRA